MADDRRWTDPQDTTCNLGGFEIFHNSICGITVNTYNFNDCHKEKRIEY